MPSSQSTDLFRSAGVQISRTKSDRARNECRTSQFPEREARLPSGTRWGFRGAKKSSLAKRKYSPRLASPARDCRNPPDASALTCRRATRSTAGHNRNLALKLSVPEVSDADLPYGAREVSDADFLIGIPH